LTDTNFPRIWGGDISEIYIGERFNVMPIPNPPDIRKILYQAKLGARAVPIAAIPKRNPERISKRLLPYLSLIAKHKIAPKIHPIRAELVPHPFMFGVVIWK
jgi:hypothetical protein